MNLFEKLNRLDDSLVESKRIVKKKKLTESEPEEWDDDIDEMLTESEEKYELSTLVKDSINHLVNDLGKDPMADDFGDDVCADLENNYDIHVPQNMVKYADWCDAVMCEVSRQINKIEEQLTETKTINQDNAQWGVHRFSTDSIIFRGTEEECIKFIDDRKWLWDDAEVYFMTPDDPHYIKDESMLEDLYEEKFANNIDKDILHALDTAAPDLVDKNFVKCSKSAVPNALYFVDKGEDVEFILGNMNQEMNSVTHCWITHNGEVLQTRVPNKDVKLVPKFKTTLVPNDIEASKKKIAELINNI